MRLSDQLVQAAEKTREVALRQRGDHQHNLLACADAFEGAAKEARELERDAEGKEAFRFRGHHLRRRFRSGRARKEVAL